MGRSIDYLSNALRVAYVDYDSEYEDENGEIVVDEFAFDDLYGEINCRLKAKFKSLDRVNEWDRRETRIFLENKLVQFGISEYCGLVSISVRVNERYSEYNGLAEKFVDKNWDSVIAILKDYSDVYAKDGTFSNGESVYSKI